MKNLDFDRRDSHFMQQIARKESTKIHILETLLGKHFPIS